MKGALVQVLLKPPFIRTKLHSKLVERVCIASGQAKGVTDLCSNSKQ